MDDPSHIRRAKYDALGKALLAYGPLVAVIVSFARWLLDASVGETIVAPLGAAVFAALFALSVLWVRFIKRG